MWQAPIFLCLALAANAVLLPQGENGTVIVQTDNGALLGKTETSIWNRTYSSFQGIPYAQPPVGELRFKSPKPVRAWPGVRDATKPGTYCPQGGDTNTTAKMSEDCLYLNVYIPQVAASASPSKGLSVMLWIHGGGFIAGSGLKDLYGPDNLMNLTAILVTINYRLGALGFLSMEHPEVTSNAGMKDVVAALRWVKGNIAHFGGNPDDVTVFGQSAGGITVELLQLSQMSEGLFHRAISQSGSALTVDFKSDYNGTREAFRLGEALGYNTTNASDLIKFLRSAAVEDILNAQNIVSSEENTNPLVNLNINPTVDIKIQEGNEVFLTDIPEKLLRAGRFQQVPYISGFNSAEMKIMTQGITQETLDSYNKNPELFIPSSLNIENGSPESLELAGKIKNFYFGNKSISFDTQLQLVNLLSDVFMIYAVHRSVLLHVNYSSSPLYTYMFTYDSVLAGDSPNSTLGPGHMEDLSYLFYSSDKSYNPDSDDMVVIHHFTDMWVDFVQTGNPSLHERVKWIPMTKTNHTYLQIDVELSLHQDALKKRMAFWDEVYDTYRK